MNFNDLKVAVAKQFDNMAKGQLFRVSVSKDDLWKTYLTAFPEGSNPMMKERTEHDCNCCKSFIRAVGDVVAIVDGKLVSVWDVTVSKNSPEYQVVADAMAKLVRSAKIENEFYHFERVAGTDKTFTNLMDGVSSWTHFHVNIPSKYVSTNIASLTGSTRTTKAVFKRGLDELTVDALETVDELIAQNSILRGVEFKVMVQEFLKAKKQYDKAVDKDLFVWDRLKTTSGYVTGFHGSAIGTLVEDLSNGTALEDAVKKYETKVGGASYKRPTALVTQKMIDAARKTIDELGYTSALQRRYATLADIDVNDILFVDRKTRKEITGDVFSELAGEVTEKKKFDKVEEVSIDKFIADILPKAESLEIMLDNNHLSNLVSLIAPVDPTAKNMFKWDNKFSWSYTGDVADSIKERVKAAGGNVTGELCCRLAWNNTDDLDFHMVEPTGYEIYFGNRGRTSTSGGRLDVDANGGSNRMDNPVENIFYEKLYSMKEGKYKLFVNQWAKRSDNNYGFEVEIEVNGVTYNFSHANRMPSGTNVNVAEFEYSKRDGLKVVSNLSSSKRSKDAWGIKTQTFQKVNVVMMSPNYWGDGGVGNKHFFFMIDGCKNEDQARGFYNEFLVEDLDKHRKVLEMVGNKLKTDSSDGQLSGVGFSVTKRDSVLVRVKGKFTRTVRVIL